MCRKYWQGIFLMSMVYVEGKEVLLLKSIRKLLKEKYWDFFKYKSFSHSNIYALNTESSEKKKYEKIGYKLGTVHRVIELLSAYELSLLLGLSVL